MARFSSWVFKFAELKRPTGGSSGPVRSQRSGLKGPQLAASGPSGGGPEYQRQQTGGTLPIAAAEPKGARPAPALEAAKLISERGSRAGQVGATAAGGRWDTRADSDPGSAHRLAGEPLRAGGATHLQRVGSSDPYADRSHAVTGLTAGDPPSLSLRPSLSA
jgi:hypothetical protein